MALAQLHQLPTLPHGLREQDAVVWAFFVRGHAARGVRNVRGLQFLGSYLDVLAGEAAERDDGQEAEEGERRDHGAVEDSGSLILYHVSRLTRQSQLEEGKGRRVSGPHLTI